MKLLVCGGRNFAQAKWCDDPEEMEARRRLAKEERFFLFETLNAVREGVTALIHGACPTGADRAAEDWALWRGVPAFGYFPEWTRLGAAAGPIRNQRMLDEEKPDLVIAFPGGRGTADMVSRALGQGFKVREVTPDVRV